MTDQSRKLPPIPRPSAAPKPSPSGHQQFHNSSGPWPSSGAAPVSQPPAESVAASAPAGGLKIVTIAPGTQSIPDIEPPTGDYLRDSGPPPLSRDPFLGYTIDGRYKIEQVLGEGGMGVVYKCTHKIIGKKVAMKVLRADLARDIEVTERFLNEAKAASAIGNPHIIDISDFGQLPDGSTYFVMEFLDGIPLSKAVEGGQPVPVARILHIARQLAEGLSTAHGAGIVHRDLKPDNIFLVVRGTQKDFVKILDFGIAKVSTSGEGRLTRAGAVFGTPHYMSPEQAAGAPVDHRGDIYSFGVILYEMASGKVPFDADNFMGILTQHMYKSPVPIRALVPQPQDVPPGLEAIVLKCLSKRPEQRYETMDEVIGDLDKLKAGLVPDAVPEMMSRSGGFNVPVDYFKKGGHGMPAPVPAEPGTPLARTRWPLIAGITGSVAAIVIVAAILATGSRSTASTQPQTALTVEPPKTEQPAPPAAAPAKKRVLLAVEPIDAHVFRGEEDLGESPVDLEIEEGQSLELQIRREGFQTKSLTLDGSQPRQSVRMERDAKVVLKAPVPKARPGSGKSAGKAAEKGGADAKGKPKPKPGIGGGEIVDPWN
jgi:eukaryotic-like serine/threonine-protein kinase